MILQNLLYPSVETTTITDMYFRTVNATVIIDESPYIQFSKLGIVETNTYFNGFSYMKWEKYTDVKSIYFNMCAMGEFYVELKSYCLVAGQIREKILGTFKFISANRDTQAFPFIVPIETRIGQLSVKITALKNDCVFYGGYYSTDTLPINSICLALNICTYKREYYVSRTLKMIKKHLLDNTESCLNGHLQVYVSDNGQSLPYNELNSEYIHVYPNRNCGGAGGFTRNLIEELKNCQEQHLTHNIFMDDDVILDHNILERLYVFLQYLKPNYKNATIGGTMLRLDAPNRPHEIGGCWDSGKFILHHHDSDLCRLDAILYGEEENVLDYNGWWFCCVPFDVINENNLPIPFYIHRDDVEYGMRNSRTIITLNGMAVWHNLDNKYSAMLDYYDQRNSLVVNALYCPWIGKKHVIISMAKYVLKNIMRYRYKENTLYLRGTEDFLKGIDFFKTTDPITLTQDLIANGYRPRAINELSIPFNKNDFHHVRYFDESKKRRRIRKLLLNGLFLKKRNGYIVVPMCYPEVGRFYRADQVINYNEFTDQAFITSKSYTLTLQNVKYLAKMIVQVWFQYDSIKKSYKQRIHEITNISFWNSYLQIEDCKNGENS